MSKSFLKIHPDDNVFVALRDLSIGEPLNFNGKSLTISSNIKAKHKFTEYDLKVGDKIFMYGITVGKATQPIIAGEILTVDNVAHHVPKFIGKEKIANWEIPDISKFSNRTFLGYHRNDGQVGTQNIWLVIPMVFCENRNVEVMKQALMEELGFTRPNRYRDYVRQMSILHKQARIRDIESLELENESIKPNSDFPNVDGIKFLTHQGGCGGIRQDSEMLCALLAGYLNNPNVAGATILSLGCQNAQLDILEEKLKTAHPDFKKPLFFLEQQREGTQNFFLAKALRQTFIGLVEANKLKRSEAPLSKLTIGLECGGSDGFSGISANPVVGHTSDLIVGLRGKTMLAEFPELCGVEQELINRCTNQGLADKFMALMRSYAASAEAVGSGFDMNPSPGNIKDGLVTDAMKSAGAAKKGGLSPIVDVLEYANYVAKDGLSLLCTPGNDVESTTALAGSGANIILFTTGLGTPTGNPVTPVIKISSNSSLANHMSDIIDFDSGPIINGSKTIEEMGEELLDFIINVASGFIKTKAQELNQDDFIPWKRGVSL